MAADLKRQLGVEAALIEGAGGIFDVKVDGKLIYSKDRTGRYPEPQEIVDALGARAGD